jgi:rubrerythrin
MSETKLPWLARRHCAGDESWTDWRPISQAEFEHRKDDSSFEFQAAHEKTDESTHGELPAVRAFQEWLNSHRDADVSSVFHEIVAKYRELALTQVESADRALGDAAPVAEWVNHEQGFQCLVEPPLPDGTKLYTAPIRASDFAIKFIEKRAEQYMQENTSEDPDDGSTIWHYGDAGREYHDTLTELAEDIRAAMAAETKTECEHKRTTTTAVGVVTNTGWKCADCGKLLSKDDAPDRASREQQPALTVWYGAMPESNGKSNFTAVLYRKCSKGCDIFTEGITIDRSEYPDRVRYEADRVRWLIGERAEKPDMMDDGYDFDKHSGYNAPIPTDLLVLNDQGVEWPIERHAGKWRFKENRFGGKPSLSFDVGDAERRTSTEVTRGEQQ